MTRVGLGLCTRIVGNTPMNGQKKGRIIENRKGLPGRIFLDMFIVEGAKENTSSHPNQPRPSRLINGNYCVKALQAGLLAVSK